MISKVKVTLSSDLKKRYGIRAFPVATGDIVKVKSGKRKGEGGKVVNVNHVNGRVSVEGITIAKEDGKQTELYLRAQDLTITKLDFSRDERLQKIRQIAAIKRITIQEPEPEEQEEEPAEIEAEATEVKEADTLEQNADNSEGESEEESEEEPEDEAESEKSESEKE
jgi:large subunit ribosomal protein L24